MLFALSKFLFYLLLLLYYFLLLFASLYFSKPQICLKASVLISLPLYFYNNRQFAQSLHKQNTFFLSLLSTYSLFFFFLISPVISTPSLPFSLLLFSSYLLFSTIIYSLFLFLFFFFFSSSLLFLFLPLIILSPPHLPLFSFSLLFYFFLFHQHHHL